MIGKWRRDYTGRQLQQLMKQSRLQLLNKKAYVKVSVVRKPKDWVRVPVPRLSMLMLMTNKDLKELKSKMNKVLNEVQQIIDSIGDNELQHQQFVLDWMDNLNKASVTY